MSTVGTEVGNVGNVEMQLVQMIFGDRSMRELLSAYISTDRNEADTAGSAYTEPEVLAEEFWTNEVESHLLPDPESEVRHARLIKAILGGIDPSPVIEAIASLIRSETAGT